MDNCTPYLRGFQVFDWDTLRWQHDTSIPLRSLSTPTPWRGDWKRHDYLAAADRAAGITPLANRGVFLTVPGFDLSIPPVRYIPPAPSASVPDTLPNVDIDFLRCTFREMQTPDFALLSDLLHVSLSGFLPGRGRDFYDRSVSNDGVTVLWLSDEKRSLRSQAMGTHVIISGDGCRFIQSVAGPAFSWPQFLHMLLDAGAVFTRFDIYKDDRDGILSLSEILDHFTQFRDAVASRYSSSSIARSWKARLVSGETVYIGNRQSGSLVRFYDKELERQHKGEPLEGPTIRCELEAHAELAHELVLEVCLNESLAWFPMFLKSRLDFKEKSGSANISRRPSVDWWARFLAVPCVYKVCLVAVEKSFTRAIRWLRDGVAGTLRRLALSIGDDDLHNVLDAMIRYNEQRKPVHIPWEHVPVDDLLDRVEAMLED